MEASCTMVIVIGKGNWERIVLPSTPLLEETTYQQTQTKTILNPSFISFLVMKLILSIEEFKAVYKNYWGPPLLLHYILLLCRTSVLIDLVGNGRCGTTCSCPFRFLLIKLIYQRH